MRDIAVKRFAENFDLTTYRDNNGQFNVAIKNVGTIISGPKFQKLETSRVNRKESLNDTANSLSITFRERPEQNLTSKFRGGKLSSLMKTRNEDILRLQNSMDEIAFNLVKTVNGLHMRCYVNRDIQVREDGTCPTSGSKRKNNWNKVF